MLYKSSIHFTIMKKLIILSKLGFIILSISFINNVFSQTNTNEPLNQTIDLSDFDSSTKHWYGIADKNNIINPTANQAMYSNNEITKIADNILLFQKNTGGWPKNYDMQAILTAEQIERVKASKSDPHATFDNSTTYTQIEYLAKVYSITKQEKYKQGCLLGIKYCLEAQYKNGGWPQYYPIEPNNYSRRITYNDGAFLGIMSLFEKIISKDVNFQFIDKKTIIKVKNAYNKGIECILNTQIYDNGRLTAWCQQHDEVTLEPAWARAYEVPSICNAESSDIAEFLMKIKNPNKRIIIAVQSAIKWFDDSKIRNTRIETIDAQTEQTTYKTITKDKIVVSDSTAKPIWTRFYELGTHRPLFSDRDSKFLYSLADVSRERRVGYAWYTYSPASAIKMYKTWQKKWAPDNNVLDKNNH